MDQKLENILLKLRDKFPQHIIEFKERKTKNLVSLTLNDKIVYEFNSDIILKDVDFLKDNKDYELYVLQLFSDPIEAYLKKHKPKRIWGKGLSLQEIQAAINNTASNGKAALYCNVSYTTYKKYAKKYGKWEEHIAHHKRGNYTTKHFIKICGIKYREQEIIDGLIPNTYSSYNLKKRLTRMGILKQECEICGFHEQRITDHKIPLLLDYRDGNKYNRKLANLRLLCLNCYYLYIGTPWFRKKGIQTSNIQIENEFQLMQSRDKARNTYFNKEE